MKMFLKIFVILSAVLFAGCHPGTYDYPENVVTSKSGSSYTITWNPVAGAEKYIIYYEYGSSSSKSLYKYTEVNTNRWTVASYSVYSSRTYYIAAVVSGKESYLSDGFSFK